MASTIEFFQKKKELRNWWAAVIDDDRFAEVMLHARSALLETYGTETIGGAKALEQILRDLPSAQDIPNFIPTPGIDHMGESMPVNPAEPAPPKPA